MKCEICGSEIGLAENECKYCGNKTGYGDVFKEIKNEYSPTDTELDTPKAEFVRRQEKIYENMCKFCGRDLNPRTGRCDYCEELITDKSGTESNIHYIKETEMGRRQTKTKANQKSNTNKTPQRRLNTRKRKKKNPFVTALVITIIMVILFAVSFVIFFRLLGGSFVTQTEEIVTPTPKPTPQITRVVQTPEPTATAEATEKPTAKPTPAQTEKAEEVETQTAEPTQEVQESILQSGRNSYAYPSDEKLISEAELEKMTRQEVKLVLQEIYARHGYTFNDDDLIEYFEGKNWYMPTETDLSEVEAKFSDIEQENREIIEEYQKKQGWRI